MFNEAKIDPRLTSHPYSGLARIYLTEARIVMEINLQLEFILAAAQECNYLERNVGVSSESQAIKQEVTNLLKRTRFSEEKIDQLQNQISKSNAHAYLAEIQISNSNLEKALEAINKGLGYDAFSVWLMRLKIFVLRSIDPSDHEKVDEILESARRFFSLSMFFTF